MIKTDACGNIQIGHNTLPQPYGWVMLRQIEDGNPQFEFAPRIEQNLQRDITNLGEHSNHFYQDSNHFYQTSMNGNQHNRPNYGKVKKWNFTSMIEQFSKRNPSLS